MKKNPMRVRCDVCGFVWTIVYLPMVLYVAARVMKRAHCPMCGAAGAKIFAARRRYRKRV